MQRFIKNKNIEMCMTENMTETKYQDDLMGPCERWVFKANIFILLTILILLWIYIILRFMGIR